MAQAAMRDRSPCGRSPWTRMKAVTDVATSTSPSSIIKRRGDARLTARAAAKMDSRPSSSAYAAKSLTTRTAAVPGMSAARTTMKNPTTPSRRARKLRTPSATRPERGSPAIALPSLSVDDVEAAPRLFDHLEAPDLELLLPRRRQVSCHPELESAVETRRFVGHLHVLA